MRIALNKTINYLKIKSELCTFIFNWIKTRKLSYSTKEQKSGNFCCSISDRHCFIVSPGVPQKRIKLQKANKIKVWLQNHVFFDEAFHYSSLPLQCPVPWSIGHHSEYFTDNHQSGTLHLWAIYHLVDQSLRNLLSSCILQWVPSPWKTLLVLNGPSLDEQGAQWTSHPGYIDHCHEKESKTILY